VNTSDDIIANLEQPRTYSKSYDAYNKIF